MMGFFVLGIIGLWTCFAIWAASKLTKYVWRKADSRPIVTIAKVLTTLIFICLTFLMPFWDQLIAYPKWQQLCATTGDFEWGPDMDEKKASGREVIIVNERVTTTTIFPNVKVDYRGQYVYDAKTNELLFKKPHYSYNAEGVFYLPSSSGNRAALFLPSCSNHSFVYHSWFETEAWLQKLKLTVTQEKRVLR